MDGGQIDGTEIQCEVTLPYRAAGGGPPGGARGASPPRRSPIRGGRRSPLRGPPGGNRPRGSGANMEPIGRRSRSPRRRRSPS